MVTHYWTVRELMCRGVVTIGMDDTLQTAEAIFEDRQFHHLVVMDQGKPVGVVSDRDLLRHISPFVNVPFSEQARDRETLKKKMHQVMSRNLITIQPDRSAAKAAQLMLKHDVSCLPVVSENGELVGILSIRDLLHWMVENQPLRPTVPTNAR